MGAFCPTGATVSVSSTGDSAARVALPSIDPVCGVIRVRWSGTGLGYTKFGGSTVDATTQDMPLGGNSTEYFKVPPGAGYVSIIGSGTVFVTAGQE